MDPWERDRNDINHDWLKNGVLRHAWSVLEMFAGGETLRDPVPKLAERLRTWERRRGKVKSLIDRLAAEMSPSRLFDRPPLVDCADGTKEWLRPLVHALWMARERIPGLAEAATRAFRAADAAYDEMNSGLASAPLSAGLEEIRRLQPLVDRFYRACGDLSKCISAFPHRVEVT